MTLARKVFLLSTVLFLGMGVLLIWIAFLNTQSTLMGAERQALMALPVSGNRQDSAGRGQGGLQFLRDQLLSSVYIAALNELGKPETILQDPFGLNQEAKEGPFEALEIHFLGVIREHYGQRVLMVKEIESTHGALSRLGQVSLFLTLLFSLIAGALSYLIARYATYPILKIAKKAEELNTDNLAYRFEIAKGAKDEMTQLKRSLNTMLEKLDLGFRIQERLTADASHELRTPIATLLGYSRMLLDWGHEKPEIVRESAQKIHRTATEMRGLIESLLLLGKVTKEEAEFEAYESQALIADIETRLLDLYPDRLIRIENDGFPERFYTAREHFILLLKIFVENGIKYSEAATPIELYFESDRIRIVDQGIGISEGDLPHIFDRFYQGSNRYALPSYKKGVGIGLSIAKEVAERLRLKIGVESKTGAGTSVTMRWN